MQTTIQNNFRARKTFAKIQKIIDIPNLINIQKQSYEKFLQADIAPEKREDVGLQGVFKSVFPIRDFNESSSLEFVSYHLEKPKYDVDECHQRGMTYSAPVKVVVRLVVWDKDEETGAQSIRDVKEQEVFFGEIPLMTENGTFIINGTERVVVSQLHRSPGAFFDHDKGKSHSSGKLLYNARIIPYRGSWIDFEFDHKDLLYVRIDRRRKLPATVLIRALGAVPDTAKKTPLEFKGTPEEILNFFYATETISIEEKGKYERSVELELLPGQRATRDIKHPKTGEIIVKKNRKFTRAAIKKLEQAKIKTLPLDPEELVTKISARDVVDEKTGEVLLECNEEVTEEKVEQLRERGINQFQVLFIDNLNVGPFLRDTLNADKISSPEEAIMEIYRRLRPGDPPTLETATNLFINLFFNPERYDLSKVGRLKLNYKFGVDEPLEQAVVTKKDILEVVRYLIDLKNGKGQIDDIDHLGNRRVRAVGELLENQYRIGLVRMERAIKERMSLQEIETLMPRPDQRQAGDRGDQGVLRVQPALAVHGPDEPALRGHPQAPPLGPGTGRPDPRARRLRGARRAPDALRPHLPDRDAGRTEHRPHRQPLHLRPRERVRLRRDALPPGGRGAGHRRGEVLLGARGGEARQRPGERRLRQEGTLHHPAGLLPQGGRVPPGAPRGHLADGRVAQPARLGGGFADPLPGERRREPRADGLEHAAPGRAAPAHGRAAGGHRHRVDGRARFGRVRGGPPRRHGRPGGRGPHRGARGREGELARRSERSRHLQPDQVPALQPEHVHQPEADREAGRPGEEERRHRRRPGHRDGRVGAGPERGGRLHALAGLQLRGLDPHQRAHRQGGRVHLHPHRGVRVHRARHQAGQGRDHPRHPERR